jgi:hypothetical protein
VRATVVRSVGTVFAIVAGDEDDDWGWWGRMVRCHERADHRERTGAASHRRNDSPHLEDSAYLEYTTERPDLTARGVTRNLTVSVQARLEVGTCGRGAAAVYPGRLRSGLVVRCSTWQLGQAARLSSWLDESGRPVWC